MIPEVRVPVSPDHERQRMPVKFGTYEGMMVVPADLDAFDEDIIDMFENAGPLFPVRND
jgi:hypothetical protein